MFINEGENGRRMFGQFVRGDDEMPMLVGLGFRDDKAALNWMTGSKTGRNAPIEVAVFGPCYTHAEDGVLEQSLRRAYQWIEQA